MPHCSDVPVPIFSSFLDLVSVDSLFEAKKEQTVVIEVILHLLQLQVYKELK